MGRGMLPRTDENHTDRLHRLALAGQLTAGIAHDFGNLLQIMVAGLGALGSSLEGAQERDLVIELSEAVRYGSALVDQLRALALGSPPDSTPWNVCRLADRMDKLFMRLVSPATLRFRFPAGKVMVAASAADLRSVLLNLVINAREAGACSISVEVDVVSAAQRDWLRLSVTDDGTGMDEDTRSRVFEPYFSTKVGGPNSGLGLYNVRRIVDSYQGKVNVESKPAVGTRFVIDLPVLAAQQG